MIVNPQGTKPVTAQPEQAVKRNAGRFPEDFMFVLTPQGVAEWRSQFVTSKADRVGPRAPMAFTEQRARRAASQWWGADRAGLDRRGETKVNVGNNVPHCLSFGGGVRVVSPPSLREAVRQAAERIVRGSADLKALG